MKEVSVPSLRSAQNILACEVRRNVLACEAQNVLACEAREHLSLRSAQNILAWEARRNVLACEAGVSIKPGVERGFASGTPGSNIERRASP